MDSKPVRSRDNDNAHKLRVNGDLGDLKVVEDGSDNEDDKFTLSKIPSDLMQVSTPKLNDVITVSKSKNVQIGNNTYFNGPVTIKQIVNNESRGVDNLSFTKDSEDDTATSVHYHDETTNPKKSVKKFQIKTWHKLTASGLCIVTVAAVCTVLTVLLTNSDDIDSLQNNVDEESATDPLVIAPNHLRIVPRSEWLAQPVENKLDDIRHPIPWVIISHTATEGCTIQSECVYRVRVIQTYHIESKKWFDIGYNFLVAGDGSAYHGRGWDYIGAHTLGYNKYSVGIGFIGTFNNEAPPKKQLDACEKLIKRGVELGKLAKDYKLFAHRQLASTLSPGDKLVEIIEKWPHYVGNISDLSELIPNY